MRRIAPELRAAGGARHLALDDGGVQPVRRELGRVLRGDALQIVVDGGEFGLEALDAGRILVRLAVGHQEFEAVVERSEDLNPDLLSALDEGMANVTAALKAKGMYDDVLFIVTTE